MILVLPTRVLNAAQVQYILEHWCTRRSFVRKHSPMLGGMSHAMTCAFFRACIPRTLHDAIYDLAKRHFGSAMLRISYNITTIPAGSTEGPWKTCRGFHCIVPLTEWKVSSRIAFQHHPEMTWLSPGRLAVVTGSELCKELANASSSPRITLHVHVTTMSGKR